MAAASPAGQSPTARARPDSPDSGGARRARYRERCRVVVVAERAGVAGGVLRGGELGGIVHTSNPVSTPEELAFQLNDANAKMLFTIGALAGKAQAAIADSKKTIELFRSTRRRASVARFARDRQGSPPYRSIPRSTFARCRIHPARRLPKGVMLTHRNIVAQLNQIEAIEKTSSRRCSACCRFFHIYEW